MTTNVRRQMTNTHSRQKTKQMTSVRRQTNRSEEEDHDALFAGFDSSEEDEENEEDMISASERNVTKTRRPRQKLKVEKK